MAGYSSIVARLRACPSGINFFKAILNFKIKAILTITRRKRKWETLAYVIHKINVRGAARKMHRSHSAEQTRYRLDAKQTENINKTCSRNCLPILRFVVFPFFPGICHFCLSVKRDKTKIKMIQMAFVQSFRSTWLQNRATFDLLNYLNYLMFSSYDTSRSMQNSYD